MFAIHDDTKASLQERLTARAEVVEQLLTEYLPEHAPHATTLMESMRYSALGGGKRLRPILMLETYCMFGGREEQLIAPFMAAIEMIHSYSLVHDDLPAMDNDEYRRGRKTTHTVYGDGMAILAGDGLLNMAYETALRAFDGCEYESIGNVALALKILARKAGFYGMVGGQSVDVESDKKNIALTDEALAYVYENKTAALLEAALMIGAILAGVGEEEIRLMEHVGHDVGIAFQIQDDILDVTSTLEELGKPIGSDDKNGKVTYVSLHGLEKAKEEVSRLDNEAVLILTALGREDAFLQELIQSLTGRRK